MSDGASSDSRALPRKLRMLLSKHDAAVVEVVKDLDSQLATAQSTPDPDPRQELLPRFVKDITTGQTIVLATANSLDELYRGDFHGIPIEITPSQPRKPQNTAADTDRINKKGKDKQKKENKFRDHDTRELRWEVTLKEGAKKPLPGRGLLLYKDGTLVLVHDFLGDQRTELIRKLHDPLRTQPIVGLPHLHTNCRLHPWQEYGAWKTVTSCQGPIRGVLNISKMGTGKTMETLVALEYARVVMKVPGSFDLVLTPRSCIGQWVKEAERTFAPGMRPRIFILRDPTITALELLKKDADIVVTTYAFLFRQAKKAKDFLRFTAAVQKYGRAEALLLAAEHRWPTKRPATPLYSNIMRERPHRHIICDEVHLIKNLHGQQHRAVRNLWYNSIIMLSGTPFSNRLTDGYAYIDLLPNEPFQKVNDILRIFGNDEHHRHLGHLQPTVQARFLKYFLSFTYGNTNEELRLPEVVHETVYFSLMWHMEARIANYVQKFVEKLMTSGASVLDLGSPTNASSNNDIMLLATRARMLAWLDDFLPAASAEHLIMVKNAATRLRMLFKEHVRQKLAEEYARNHGLKEKCDDEGIDELMVEEDMDEIPAWANIDQQHVRELDRYLPANNEEAAHFMRSFIDWSRDADAVAQKKRLLRDLKSRGIDVPSAKKPTKGPVVRSEPSQQQTGEHFELLIKNSAAQSAEKPVQDDDAVHEVEPAPREEDQEELEDLSNDVATGLLADESNDNPTDDKKHRKTFDKRTVFREQLKQKPLATLLCPRIKAAIDTWQRIRRDFPNDHGLIWSQSVQFLDVLAEALSRREMGSISAIRFDGDCDDTDRAIAIDDFKSALPDRPMLTSTGAGGAGINLAFANQLILCETLWNHQDELQVIDRCHRQPQQKKVYVYRLFAVNSAVDFMIQLAKEKKWAVIEPIMKQLIRTKDVELQIPEVAKWFVPIDVQSPEVTEAEDHDALDGEGEEDADFDAAGETQDDNQDEL